MNEISNTWMSLELSKSLYNSIYEISRLWNTALRLEDGQSNAFLKKDRKPNQESSQWASSAFHARWWRLQASQEFWIMWRSILRFPTNNMDLWRASCVLLTFWRYSKKSQTAWTRGSAWTWYFLITPRHLIWYLTKDWSTNCRHMDVLDIKPFVRHPLQMNGENMLWEKCGKKY